MNREIVQYHTICPKKLALNIYVLSKICIKSRI